MQGVKIEDVTHHGSRYGNIRSSSNPAHNSVMNESSLTTSAPSVPVPFILAASPNTDITIVQHNAITLIVSMLFNIG